METGLPPTLEPIHDKSGGGGALRSTIEHGTRYMSIAFSRLNSLLGFCCCFSQEKDAGLLQELRRCYFARGLLDNLR